MKSRICFKNIFFITLLISFCSILLSCNQNKKSNNEIKRIVSLGPAATEILFAIGAQEQIVARTDFCNYPPEVEKIPSVGGFSGKTFSLESILFYEPDMVYLFSGMHDYLIKPLEALGIKVYVSNASSIGDVEKEILEVAEITGHKKMGEVAVEKMRGRLALCMRKIAEDSRPKVYWEVWSSPYMSAGNGSFINSVIRAAGGKNIFSDEEQAYPIVNEEAIIQAQPDFIFIPSDSPVTVEEVASRPSWSSIPAVKNHNIIIIDSDLCSRSGPRCVKAVEQLNSLFWNEENKEPVTKKMLVEQVSSLILE